jgi:hypothetical protein
VIGLSGWRTASTSNPRVKVIVQGKLRVAIEHRRRGLHHAAGLAYYFSEQIRQPLCTFVFLSIASLYNFVSMRKRCEDEPHMRGDDATFCFSVSEYWILNNPQAAAKSPLLKLAYECLERMIADDHFRRYENGAIFVHVRIAESIVAEFPPAFYKSPEAQEYIQANPKWREGATDERSSSQGAHLSLFLQRLTSLIRIPSR